MVSQNPQEFTAESGLSGAEAILRILGKMGVERIFASPGSEWYALWECLAKPYAPGEFRVYCSTRHEETAVAMATGYAKVTGKLPAVILHSTVGSLHATMALRAAVHERVPMVVLAGESVAFGEDEGPDPGDQWLAVLADLGGPAKLAEPSVKWSFGLNTAAILPATIQRACQLAVAVPQGPVFVSIPWEFMFETVKPGALSVTALPKSPAANSEAIDELAQALVASASPLVITEYVGRSVRAVDHLVVLAELLGAPVFEGWHPGYLNFPRAHPLYGGIRPTNPLYGGTSPKIGFSEFLNDFDLLLLIDTVLPWHPPSSAPGARTRVAVLGDDPLHAPMPFWGFRCDLIVPGQVETSLAMLVDRVRTMLPPDARASSIERWRERHVSQRQKFHERSQIPQNKKSIDARLVLDELNQILPSDAIVVDETITHRLEILRRLDCLTPGRYFNACYGGLGLGLGTALGVKVARPDQAVINLIGDGGFNYNPVLPSLGACQEHRIPILIVIFNNAGYLSQKAGIPQHFPDGWAVKSNTFIGTSITPTPDYSSLARMFDGYGEKVEDPGQVRAALLRGLEAISRGQLALIDIKLEPIN